CPWTSKCYLRSADLLSIFKIIFWNDANSDTAAHAKPLPTGTHRLSVRTHWQAAGHQLLHTDSVAVRAAHALKECAPSASERVGAVLCNALRTLRESDFGQLFGHFLENHLDLRFLIWHTCSRYPIDMISGGTRF